MTFPDSDSLQAMQANEDKYLRDLFNGKKQKAIAEDEDMNAAF